MSYDGFVFVLVAEDHAHRSLVVHLADRVACQHHPWLADLLDDSYRRWQGLTHETPFLKWSQIDPLCEAHGVPRVHGLGLGLQRRASERVLRLLRTRAPRPHAVVLICDADRHGRQEIHDSMDGARRSGWPFPVAIGVCHPEAEAWFLCGYIAQGDEASILQTLRQELGFHPCADAARLSSGRDNQRRSAKRVLGQLVHEQAQRAAATDRAQRCVRDTDLAHLHQHGQHTGLSAFLDELTEHLAPCFVR